MLRVQGVCKASSGVQPCAATTKIVHLHIIAILSNPMSLTPEQVQQVAHLARLAVPPERLPAYAQQLSNILAMVDQLSSANTEGVAPMAHPLGLTQRLRPDQVTETDRRDTYQAHAPAVADGLFLVPKVIE